uniref:Egg coat matrix protein n=1 Tax=Stichopus japonicus TaxID=307972 RepID=E3WHU2_STIJA|nr:egg coat matrix protein [Apostichopus japonicus]
MDAGFSRLLILTIFLSFFSQTFAVFGDDISQDNEDNRFAEMGQVTKNTFDITDGQVELIFDVQDTKNIDELWILDFEPYRFDEFALPVNELTGELILNNTGDCSSVYETVQWTFFNDSYFRDRNEAQLSTKNLFTSFVSGENYDGDGIRTDQIIYRGTIASFFECKKSDEESDVWVQTNTSSDDEIEYRTKVYATNVRPKDPADNEAGVSFVQSHIELIWRLSRQAISNFIISSTAVLKPVIDFARVSAIFDGQGEPIPEETRLHLRFTTILDSDEQIVSYNSSGTQFTPDNPLHGLKEIVYEPTPTLDAAPVCDRQLDVGTGTQFQCHQTWNFIFVLDIDTASQTKNFVPIDASGTFDFFFDVYSCDLTQNVLDKATCNKIDPAPAKVSTLITIQTTVFITDKEDDQVSILLVSLKGANNDELSGVAARGVAHKEDVTLQVKFSPALLRKDYDLDLMLFMVCKGEQYAGENFLQGCLQAPISERYVAHKASEFLYTVLSNTSTALATYTVANLTDDYLQPLTSQGYVTTDEEGEDLSVPYHEATFKNVALSAESSNYTITNVYKLIDKARRRRRVAPEHWIIARHAIRSGYITASSYSTTTYFDRPKRDIDDSLADSHGARLSFGAVGCPEGAWHDEDLLDCICPENTMYSLTSFQCEPALDDVQVVADEEVAEVDRGSDAYVIKPSLCFLSLLMICYEIW